MGHKYSKEEKMAAIQLFNKLGHYTWVITELGYPSRGMLMLWVKEYKSTGQVTRKDTHILVTRKRVSELFQCCLI